MNVYCCCSSPFFFDLEDDTDPEFLNGVFRIPFSYVISRIVWVMWRWSYHQHHSIPAGDIIQRIFFFKFFLLLGWHSYVSSGNWIGPTLCCEVWKSLSFLLMGWAWLETAERVLSGASWTVYKSYSQFIEGTEKGLSWVWRGSDAIKGFWT